MMTLWWCVASFSQCFVFFTSRCCFGLVLVLLCWCPKGVSLVFQWRLGNALVMSRRRLGRVAMFRGCGWMSRVVPLVIQWWHLALLMFRAMSQWCLGNVSGWYRQCFGFVELSPCWCPGDASIIFQWRLRDVTWMFLWCDDLQMFLGCRCISLIAMLCWCPGDVSALFRWCHGGVSVVSRCFAMFRWCGGLRAISWSCLVLLCLCFMDVPVMCRTCLLRPDGCINMTSAHAPKTSTFSMLCWWCFGRFKDLVFETGASPRTPSCILGGSLMPSWAGAGFQD